MNNKNTFYRLVKWAIAIGLIVFLMDQCFKENAKEAAWKNDPSNTQRHFSNFDGSLPVLKEYVKERLNDPGSFEHVETTFYDRKDGYLNVKMVFRSKNDFNAIITKKAFCELSIITGNIGPVTIE